MFHLFIIKNIRLPTFLSFLYSTSSPKQTCLAADRMIQIHVLAIFSEILVSIYLSLVSTLGPIRKLLIQGNFVNSQFPEM